MNVIPEPGTGPHEDYLTRLDEERAAAGPVPDSAEAAYEDWIAERDPADVGSQAGFTAGWRAAIAVAGGWPLCPNGCGCRLGTEDADRKECACDGLCCYDEVEVSEVFAERDRLLGQLDMARAALRDIRDTYEGEQGPSGQGEASRALAAIAELDVPPPSSEARKA